MLHVGCNVDDLACGLFRQTWHVNVQANMAVFDLHRKIQVAASLCCVPSCMSAAAWEGVHVKSCMSFSCKTSE